MSGGENVGVYLTAPKQIKIAPTGAPKIITEDDVMVEIKCVGVSFSDKKFYLDGHDGDASLKEPFILGQEASGVVLQVGKAVTDFSRGDRICLRSTSSCLKCKSCKSGQEHLCGELKRYGAASPDRNGFLRTSAVVPQDICHIVPDSVDMESGSIMGSIAQALFMCKQAGICKSSSICINGFGAFGSVLLIVAKSYGIINILVSDTSEYRVNLAKSKGATCGILMDSNKSAQENADELKRSCNFLPDISFECSGTELGTGIVKLVTKSKGSIAIAGNKNFNLPESPNKSSLKILDFQKIAYSRKEFLESIEMVSAGQVKSKELITNVFELSKAERAFKTVTSGSDQSVMKSIFKVCHGEY